MPQSIRITLVAAITMIFLNGAVFAQTPSPADQPAKAGTKKKSAKPKAADKNVKTRFLNGSEESPGERSARLKRECKGAVNAGACTGYTR